MENLEKLRKELGVSEVVCKILLNRGYNKEESKKFLEASLENLLDPNLMKNMGEFVEKIKEVKEKNGKIMIHGDYDVDGVVSTAMLIRYFRQIGIEVFHYIPNRLVEDYGLSKKGVDYALENNADLIITVDCGINAREEIDYSKSKGLEVLVTDHHEIESKPSVPFLNPKGDNYPFKDLAGSGVVLKLIQGLMKEFGYNSFEKYLELAAIGTVSDIVKLVGENRIIVKNGLVFLNKTGNEGIKELKKLIGIREVKASDISFKIGPRINAAGRLGEADLALELLVGDNVEELAKKIDKKNKIRQKIERKVLDEARKNILGREVSEDKFIVVGGKGWHKGVIGIVASRIVEEFYRPTVVIAKDDGKCYGSGRSIRDFNLFDSLSRFKDYFESFGGHEMAAGLSMKKENIEEFRKKIKSHAEGILSEEDVIPSQRVDMNISLSEINKKVIRDLDRLRPFGFGNPRPVFCSDNLRASKIKILKDKHLKMKIGDGVNFFNAIGFNMASYFDKVKDDKEVSLYYSPEINNFNGENIQLRIKEID